MDVIPISIDASCATHGSLANFQQRIEAGAKAGNVCTRNEPRADVAGVDCSAFVSAA